MPEQRDEKREFLESSGALNPHPESVQDENFRGSEFFDPRDLVQVRYEMLRRHFSDDRSVAEAARLFGLSRQFFYRLAAVFAAEGLYGLLPKKRGPKGPHKCSKEVLDFAEKLREKEPETDLESLCAKVKTAFKIDLHPRTLEKVLGRRKKKRDR